MESSHRGLQRRVASSRPFRSVKQIGDNRASWVECGGGNPAALGPSTFWARGTVAIFLACENQILRYCLKPNIFWMNTQKVQQCFRHSKWKLPQFSVPLSLLDFKITSAPLEMDGRKYVLGWVALNKKEKEEKGEGWTLVEHEAAPLMMNLYMSRVKSLCRAPLKQSCESRRQRTRRVL